MQYLPFLVMIISVPTVLNCFHRDTFSSSIFIMSSDFPKLSLFARGGGSRRGGRLRAAMSHVVGYRGTWAGGSRSGGQNNDNIQYHA